MSAHEAGGFDVVSGTVSGAAGPATNQWPVRGVFVSLDPGAATDLALPASHRAFAYVLSGDVSIAGQLVRSGQTAWSDPVDDAADDSLLPLAVSERAEPASVMIYSGRPIGEPVAMGGPFVMNTRSEIAQAFADFHAGAFGEVPRQGRLTYDR